MASTYGPNVPPLLAQIFADAVLRVGQRLKIDAEVSYEQRNDNCPFIRIKPDSFYDINSLILSSYSQSSTPNLQAPLKVRYFGYSTLNLNTHGLDFHYWEDRFNKDKFSLPLEVGVKHHWYNETFLPKLKDYLNATTGTKALIAEFLLKNYEGCNVGRGIRINKRLNSIKPRPTIRNYDSLKDYINDIDINDIYKNRQTTEDCINKLKSFLRDPYNQHSISDAIQTLNRWAYSDEYNYLEQFAIVPPETLNLDEILAEDPAAIAELEHQIEIHLIGMVIFDFIYQH